MATYEEERASRRRGGEVWPAATTLIRLFATWHRVQIAAIDLAFRGTKARRASSLEHTGSRAAYTPAEIRELLIETRRVLDVWPLSGEYFEYRRLRRRAARFTGSPEPRLPSMTPINRHYGGYDEALRDAQAEVGELPPPAAHGDPLVSKHSRRAPPEDGVARLTPAAGHWWRLVQGLAESDRRFLWVALLGSEHTTNAAVTDHCHFALRTCADDTPGGRPSRKVYDSWRANQSRPDEWPGSSTILGRFGSWSGALEVIGGEPTPDVLAHRLRGRTPRFAVEELMHGIAVCGSDWKATHPGRALRLIDYKRWAAAEMAGATPRFDRLALSDKTITQHMTWAQALVAAGHEDLLGHNAMIFTRCNEFSDDDLFDWLHRAAVDFNKENRLMTSRTYDEWASEIQNQLRASDPTATVPHSPQMIRRFGSWLDPARRRADYEGRPPATPPRSRLDERRSGEVPAARARRTWGSNERQRVRLLAQRSSHHRPSQRQALPLVSSRSRAKPGSLNDLETGAGRRPRQRSSVHQSEDAWSSQLDPLFESTLGLPPGLCWIQPPRRRGRCRHSVRPWDACLLKRVGRRSRVWRR